MAVRMFFMSPCAETTADFRSRDAGLVIFPTRGQRPSILGMLMSVSTISIAPNVPLRTSGLPPHFGQVERNHVPLSSYLPAGTAEGL